MRPHRGIATILGSGLLVGCAGAKPEAPAPSSGEIPVTGTYRHVVTKLELPESIGPFPRSAVRSYDPAAWNVSGHYELGGDLAAIATVYHHPATDDPDDSGNPCERLADAYELIARNQDMGLTRERQLEFLETGDTPVEQAARVVVLNALDVAYAHPEKSAAEIRAMVHADCERNDEGQASLRTLWPSKRR